MLGEQDSPSQSQSLGASSFDFTQDDTLLGVNDFSSIRIDHADTVANLTQAWINERNAPELLPYKRYLVEPLLKAIEDQTEMIMDTMDNPQRKFISMLFQNEIERIKFVVRSYLRTRLYKIEKCTLEILRRANQDDNILSPQETAYARRYQELLESHNHDSFLHLMPAGQHKQDEKVADYDMVVRANMEAPVFIRVRENCGPVQLDQRDEETTMLEKDDIYILRYNVIRDMLLGGNVELI
ncbi:hypothetical protein LRAMOSA02100 [Lichtheimia ramosa]|uniref:DNA replication complex GINS protein SLD5 n=1 Tax=Lichtheimia ramosa TaxID=688394 RepID=A0A077WN04_9FUNG|nr:hypothetical protein LRAMOSA02100 [Lichtheimia ramosa]